MHQLGGNMGGKTDFILVENYCYAEKVQTNVNSPAMGPPEATVSELRTLLIQKDAVLLLESTQLNRIKF